MWRRLNQIFAWVGWVLALLLILADGFAKGVGWLAVPDDVKTYVVPVWNDWVAPVLTWETAHLILFVWATAALVWVSFGEAIAEWIKRRRAAPLRVMFSEEANMTFPPSRYRGGCTLGLRSDDGEGIKLDGAVSRESYGFGVKSEGPGTARRVQAELLSIAHAGGGLRPARVSLDHVTTGKQPVDIQPGEEQLFRLIELYIPGPAGIYQGFQAVDKETLDYLYFLATTDMMSWPPQGAASPNLKDGFPIGLPPRPQDEIRLDVAIYSDDRPPTFARFAMRRAERVTIHLTAQGLSLPREKDVSPPSREGIARRTLRRIRRG